MMRRVFDLGYRRYEWKRDALNAPSRRAGARPSGRSTSEFAQPQASGLRRLVSTRTPGPIVEDTAIFLM